MSLDKKFRRSWRAAVPIGILAAGVLSVAPLAASSAGALGLGGSLYVSTTGSDTSNCAIQTPCKTINYAISQANPLATIHVAAGNYLQTATVNKDVTIDGAGSGTVLEPLTPTAAGNDPDTGYPTWAIVNVTHGSDATIENLSINGAPASGFFNQFGCADDYVGVYFSGASGKLSAVNVNDVELPTGLFGCQDGLAVYVNSPAGDHANVSMTGLVVSNYDKNGITCNDSGTTCTVDNSTVTGVGPTGLIAQNGIQAFGVASATIQGDTVSQNSYTAVSAPPFGNQATGLLIQDVGKLTALHNTVSRNDINIFLGSDGTGPHEGSWVVRYNGVSQATDNVRGGFLDYGDGIQIDGVTDTGLVVNQNTVTGSAENGISLLSTAGITVSSNTVEANDDNGIYVGGPGFNSSRNSTANKVTDNQVFNNNQDGILADSDTNGNTFRGNGLGGNGRFDIEDLDFAANTFSMNSCSPAGDSNPSGLC